jgi:hypothetical protein
MKTGRYASCGVALIVASLVQTFVYSQGNQGVTTPAAQYFANRQLNTEVPSQPIAIKQQVRQPLQTSGVKPFENIQRQPTLSPYLGLDAVPESSTSLPNWHLFVQPQMQQRNSAESQARELIRMRQQMRAGRVHVASQNSSPGIPTTGSSSQFMNVGGYFPGLR